MAEIAIDSTRLMVRRIRKILLICNHYDSFSLEEDGRLDEQIVREYSELRLSNPPSIVRVESTIDALKLLLGGDRYDLVITMFNAGDMDVFEFSGRMKAVCPDTPLVLLTSVAREIQKKVDENDTSNIDYVFCWNSSTDLIIAIIKLIEDKMNADRDILESGVRAILLVEDSIRYYSTYLPLLYKLVLQQNIEALQDALNESQQNLRKRSRPKILMAGCYEEAINIYERYKDNLLGVISDVGFVIHKGDAPETEQSDAGIDLCIRIRKDNPTMPILMQSSQESMRAVAEKLGVDWRTVKDAEKRVLSAEYKTVDLKGVTRIGIDELYVFGNERKSRKYITVVRDLDSGRVLNVSRGKGEAALKEFAYRLRKQKVIDRIRCVCMDMSNAYYAWVGHNLRKDTLIVFDHFHVVMKMNEHINSIRSGFLIMR